MRGENPCAEPKLDTSHYIPNTYHYMPIHTMIHTRYTVLHTVTTQERSPPSPVAMPTEGRDPHPPAPPGDAHRAVLAK